MPLDHVINVEFEKQEKRVSNVYKEKSNVLFYQGTMFYFMPELKQTELRVELVLAGIFRIKWLFSLC